jgi:hypothetical protein
VIEPSSERDLTGCNGDRTGYTTNYNYILSMSENGVYPPNSICYRGKMMINIDKP